MHQNFSFEKCLADFQWPLQDWIIFFLDIQKRLGELGNKRPTGGEDSSQLLAELRAQEERNQRSLDDLKRQLYDINHQRINVMYVNLPIINIITSVIYMYILSYFYPWKIIRPIKRINWQISNYKFLILLSLAKYQGFLWPLINFYKEKLIWLRY